MSVPKTKLQLELLCRMNVFYHENRERHFSNSIRWSTFLTLVLGSATAVSLSDIAPNLFDSKALGIWLALVVSILSAASLAFDWFGCMATHSRFKGKWTSLLIDTGVLEETDTAGFKMLLRKLEELNADEPPPNVKALARADVQARATLK